MRRTETVRIVAIVVILIAAFYFLLPTIRLMTTSDEEIARLKTIDRFSYDKLIRNSIKLGLDLQGGLRLVLEPEVDDIKSQAGSNFADQALIIISNRINGMGLTEPEIRKRKNNQIVVEIPGIDSVSVADAKEQISQIAKLEFRFLETPAVTEQTITSIDSYLASKYGDEYDTAPDTADVEALETDSAEETPIEAEAPDTQAVDDSASAVADVSEDVIPEAEEDMAAFAETSISAYLMPADRSSFYVKSNIDRVRKILSLPEVQALIPEKSEFLFSTGAEDFNGIFYERLYLVKKEIVLTGETIENISPGTDQFNKPEVDFTPKSNYRAQWASVTGNNLQKPLAICLDGRVESAPNIQDQIIGPGRITMRSGATFVDAQKLANVLKSGALPTRLLIKEDVIIGPSLGKDSIRKGITASILGLLIVVAFMLFYYRASGIVAAIALVFNLFVLMGVLVVLNATLTVPGVAGIVLLVGISVDAAVLIFERIREELRAGKPVRAAIDAGYGRATVAIVDSNITTLIVAGLLYYIGSGPVKGFAITLVLGILISLFSALVVTRTIFEFRKTYKKLSI
jgi:SecD/SecF fusion protein